MDFSRRFWSRSVWVPSLVVGLLMLIAWSVRWRQNSERGVEAVRQQVVELLQRAEQNLNAGRTAAARKNYETVLELNPAEPVALLFMAGYLQQEGHSDDARALLARLGPVSDQLQATADFLLGGLELQSGRAVVGEQLLLSAHQRNSRYAAPLRDLARLYALQMRATEQNQMLLLLEQIRPLTKEELAMRLLAGRPITETKQATEQLRGYLQQAPEDRASLLGLLRTLRLDQSPQQVLAELEVTAARALAGAAVGIAAPEDRLTTTRPATALIMAVTEEVEEQVYILTRQLFVLVAVAVAKLMEVVVAVVQILVEEAAERGTAAADLVVVVDLLLNILLLTLH
mgnify:CR=1 FL=1